MLLSLIVLTTGTVEIPSARRQVSLGDKLRRAPLELAEFEDAAQRRLPPHSNGHRFVASTARKIYTLHAPTFFSEGHSIRNPVGCLPPYSVDF